MFKTKIAVLILITVAIIAKSSQTRSELNWGKTVSSETIADSWGTWHTNFSAYNPTVDHSGFMRAVASGAYKTLSIDEFLSLNIQNQRLARYLDAKTAEEAYPKHDRPRAQEDIDSVNYLLETSDEISPIIVARVSQPDDPIYIKLDGAHRIIAAAIKKSPIRILFVDL